MAANDNNTAFCSASTYRASQPSTIDVKNWMSAAVALFGGTPPHQNRIEILAKERTVGAVYAHQYFSEGAKEGEPKRSLTQTILNLRKYSWNSVAGFLYHTAFRPSTTDEQLQETVTILLELFRQISTEGSRNRWQQLQCWEDIFIIHIEAVLRRSGGNTNLLHAVFESELPDRYKIIAKASALVYTAFFHPTTQGIPAYCQLMQQELIKKHPWQSPQDNSLYLFVLQALLQIKTILAARGEISSYSIAGIHTSLRMPLEQFNRGDWLNLKALENTGDQAALTPDARSRLANEERIFNSIPDRFRLPFGIVYADTLGQVRQLPDNITLNDHVVTPDGLILRSRTNLELNQAGDCLRTKISSPYLTPNGDFVTGGTIEWDHQGMIMRVTPENLPGEDFI